MQTNECFHFNIIHRFTIFWMRMKTIVCCHHTTPNQICKTIASVRICRINIRTASFSHCGCISAFTWRVAPLNVTTLRSLSRPTPAPSWCCHTARWSNKSLGISCNIFFFIITQVPATKRYLLLQLPNIFSITVIQQRVTSDTKLFVTCIAM